MNLEKVKFIKKFEDMLAKIALLKNLNLKIKENKYSLLLPDGSICYRITISEENEKSLNVEIIKKVISGITTSKKVFVENAISHLINFLPKSIFNFVLLDDKIFISRDLTVSLKFTKFDEYSFLVRLFEISEDGAYIKNLLETDLHIQSFIKLN